MSPQRDNANHDAAAQPDITVETAPAAEAPATEAPAATEPTAKAAEPATASPKAEPPAAEPVAPQPQPAGTPAPAGGIGGGGAFVMGVLASVLVLGALGAVAWATLPEWQPKVAALFVPPEVTANASRVAQQAAALETRTTQLEQTLGSVRGQLAQIEKAVPAAAGGKAVDPARVDALAQRLAALETAPRFDPNQLAAARQTVDAVAGELAAVRKDVTLFQGLGADLRKDNAAFKDEVKAAFGEFKQNSVAPNEVLKLAQRVDAAEAAVKQVQSRTQKAQALLIATGQLREAVYRGAAFDAELRAVKVIAEGDGETAKALQPIESLADKGVPTRGELTSQFSDISPAIIRADVLPEQPGWWRQTVQSLASVVTVRRVDGEAAGDSVAAKVARAQATLDKGDLGGAFREVASLQGAPAEAAAPWLAKAQARLTAEQALSNMTAHAVAVAQAKG
jgi:uroporphyrinogen-III synthase